MRVLLIALIFLVTIALCGCCAFFPGSKSCKPPTPRETNFCAQLPLDPNPCKQPCGPAATNSVKVPKLSCEACETYAAGIGCHPHCEADGECIVECRPYKTCAGWDENRCNSCAGGGTGIWTPPPCDQTPCANSAPPGCGGHCGEWGCNITCP